MAWHLNMRREDEAEDRPEGISWVYVAWDGYEGGRGMGYVGWGRVVGCERGGKEYRGVGEGGRVWVLGRGSGYEGVREGKGYVGGRKGIGRGQEGVRV